MQRVLRRPLSGCAFSLRRGLLRPSIGGPAFVQSLRYASSKKNKGNASPTASATKPTTPLNASVAALRRALRRAPSPRIDPDPEEPYRPVPAPDHYSVFPDVVDTLEDLRRPSEPQGPRKSATKLTYWEAKYRTHLLQQRVHAALLATLGTEPTSNELDKATDAVLLLRRNPGAYLGDGPSARALRKVAQAESTPYAPGDYEALKAGAMVFRKKIVFTGFKVFALFMGVLFGGYICAKCVFPLITFLPVLNTSAVGACFKGFAKLSR